MFNNIFFFKPGAIGDLLHTLPSLKSLRQAFPEARITLVVSPGLDLLLEGTNIADRILVFDKNRMKKSPGDFMIFLNRLRREQYDLFADMQPSFRSRVMRWFSGSRCSLVYKKQKSVKAGERRFHAVENFMDTLAPIGVAGPVDRIELPVRHEADVSVDAFLVSRGIRKDKPLIALNCGVGAARPSRNWFPDRFSLLADRIIRELDAAVIFIGGPEDRELVENVLKGMSEKAFSAAGDLNLAETAALLGRCRSLVSSDTGPLHLATAVQTPVIGLFGSTDPLRTGPVGRNNRVILKKLSCVPCDKKVCPLSTRACMSAITVENVLSELRNGMHCSDVNLTTHRFV
jgi:lipopolysaccharide heptosyltransferase II